MILLLFLFLGFLGIGLYRVMMYVDDDNGVDDDNDVDDDEIGCM